jgi:drug/metabolite transporter (DMT)-like permease
LILAAACWGLATVISKGVLGYFPPLTLLVIQLTVSASFLWAIVAGQRRHVPISKRNFQLGLIGVLNPGLAYTFSLIGLTLTTASMSTLIWAAEPILILGLAWLILCERLTRPLIAFSVVAIIGVFLVAGIDLDAGRHASVLGNVLTLIGVGCCALYTVLTRRVVANADPIVLVALQQTFALAWALMIWPIEWSRGELANLTAVSLPVWLLAVASGIIYYGLAFWFYITGLKRASASLAGLFLNLIPIFGVGGAYLFLGERLTIVQWLGAILILTAVVGALRLGRVEPIPVSNLQLPASDL